MERFEIALSLNDKELLIPSMLPKEKPGMQLHQLQKLIRRKSSENVRLKYPPLHKAVSIFVSVRLGKQRTGTKQTKSLRHLKW